MNKNIFIALAFCLVTAACAYTCYSGNNTKPVSRTSQLIVGTAGGYAPFVSVNESGEYEGFDIDVARALAQELGRELVIKDLGSMSPLFIALEQGAIDCIIWGLSVTEDRCKKVRMIHYQGDAVTAYPLLFWDTIPENLKTINDLHDLTICVEPASSQDALLAKYPAIVSLPVEKIDDALLAIQYGKADAALVEPAIARKFMDKYPNIQALWLPLPEEDIVRGVGMAVKKDAQELQQKLADAIDALTTRGVIKQLEATWNIA